MSNTLKHFNILTGAQVEDKPPLVPQHPLICQVLTAWAMESWEMIPTAEENVPMGTTLFPNAFIASPAGTA